MAGVYITSRKKIPTEMTSKAVVEMATRQKKIEDS